GRNWARAEGTGAGELPDTGRIVVQQLLQHLGRVLAETGWRGELLRWRTREFYRIPRHTHAEPGIVLDFDHHVLRQNQRISERLADGVDRAAGDVGRYELLGPLGSTAAGHNRVDDRQQFGPVF